MKDNQRETLRRKKKTAPTKQRSNFSSNRKIEDEAEGNYKRVKISMAEPEKETKKKRPKEESEVERPYDVCAKKRVTEAKSAYSNALVSLGQQYARDNKISEKAPQQSREERKESKRKKKTKPIAVKMEGSIVKPRINITSK